MGCKLSGRGWPDGSTRPGTYIRRHRAKRSDSPRLLPLRPSLSSLDRGRKLAQSVSEARGQSGRWPTHRRQRGTPSSPARSAPAWTARPPQRLRVLWARDAHVQCEHVRRGAGRGPQRACRTLQSAAQQERLSLGSGLSNLAFSSAAGNTFCRIQGWYGAAGQSGGNLIS